MMKIESLIVMSLISILAMGNAQATLTCDANKLPLPQVTSIASSGHAEILNAMFVLNEGYWTAKVQELNKDHSPLMSGIAELATEKEQAAKLYENAVKALEADNIAGTLSPASYLTSEQGILVRFYNTSSIGKQSHGLLLNKVDNQWLLYRIFVINTGIGDVDFSDDDFLVVMRAIHQACSS